MSEEWTKYVDDPRHICKYGSKCYQKNPQHLVKYKHPPHSKRKPVEHQRGSKRPKIQAQSPEPQQEHVQIAREPDKNPRFSDPSSPECKGSPVQNRTSSDHNSLQSGDSSAKPHSTSAENSTDKLGNANKLSTIELLKDTPAPTTLSPEELVDTSIDKAKLIKELFLFDMPQDFYSFWQFVSKENESGIDILKTINMELIGVFDVLTDKLPRVEDKSQYLVHWRFFYDPPEFQTMYRQKQHKMSPARSGWMRKLDDRVWVEAYIKHGDITTNRVCMTRTIIKSKGKSEFHMGYFRDSPSEDPVFVGSNDSSKSCTITPIGYNIFGAVYLHLQAEKKKSPFTAMSYQKVMDKIKLWADKNKFTLEQYNTRKRMATVAVTRTFHGAGIVVPYDKSTQLGYRPLVENDVGIKKMLTELQSAESNEKKNKILSDLQPVITYANIAVDECDFGTGLELGIDLFCSAVPELEATMMSALTNAYTLLNRQAFLRVIEAHMKYRRTGADLSVLNLR